MKIKKIIVLFMFLILINFVSAPLSLYDFVQYTTQTAFGESNDAGTVTTAGSTQHTIPPLLSEITSTNNFTSAGYSALTAIDASYAIITSDNNNREPYASFNFTIEEPVATIDWLNITLVQNQIAQTDTNCYYYIANWTSGLFEEFFPSMSGTTDVVGTHNYSTQYELSNILSVDNALTLVSISSADLGEGCNINFVNVTVDYTEVADTCTYSSGDWLINCADDCVITSNTNVGANDIILYGTGTLSILANITANSIAWEPGCAINNMPNDGNWLIIDGS